MARVIRFNQANFSRAKEYALGLLDKANQYGKDFEVEFRYPTRSTRQNALIHALIGDVSKQVQHYGKYLPLEYWKAGLVDLFAQEKKSMGEPLRKGGAIMPALDGSDRFVSIRPSTRDFSVSEANEFIDYIFYYGAENGVKFIDRTLTLKSEWDLYLQEMSNKKSK